jgi:hypothetical protein
MYCIEMGIVEQISQHGIRKLVMGAAADKHYSKYKPQMILVSSSDVLTHYVHFSLPFISIVNFQRCSAIG